MKWAEIISGGKNNRIYKVVCQNDANYVLKHYYHHPLDDRDRMDTELRAIKLLRHNDVECVPKLLNEDRIARVAVFDYIEGNKIADITDSDIDQAADFLCAIKRISDETDPGSMPFASEAFFSATRIIENIQERLDRFKGVPDNTRFSAELDDFLEINFCPAFEYYSRRCIDCFDELNISAISDLKQHERVLSPSDFGFHNGIKGKDGLIKFVDFEYFGWDDPAKLICDFVMHPAMELSDKQKEEFSISIIDTFSIPLTGLRARAYYPLFRLKWCLIMLNEFLPIEIARRKFSSNSDANLEKRQKAQLRKAEAMFNTLKEEHEKICRFLS